MSESLLLRRTEMKTSGAVLVNSTILGRDGGREGG